MKTEIETEKLKAAHAKANAAGKKLLEGLHGAAMFKPKITDKVKTFADACKVLGIKQADAEFASMPKALTKEGKSLQAQAKLIIIARALNQGWVPDWNNSNQAKWYPWFTMGAGFGFSDTIYDVAYSHTTVGSRLYFETRDLAEYAGKQFKELYKEFLTY